MTIGTEEANRLVVDGLRDFMAGEVNAAPHFDRIALIGFGLIGGSIARAARAQGLAREIVTTARSAKTRARVMELGIVDRVVETNAEAAEGADLVILCIPVGACGPVAAEISGSSQARRDHLRRRLGQGRGGQGHGAASAGQRAFRAGASGGGHRTFRTRLRLSPNSSSTAGASSPRRKAPTPARPRNCARSGPRSAPRSRS